MQCPMCDGMEFVIPRFKRKDWGKLLRLRSRIKCYRCSCVFIGNSLDLLKLRLYHATPRLPVVRIRATGFVAHSLRAVLPGSLAANPRRLLKSADSRS